MGADLVQLFIGALEPGLVCIVEDEGRLGCFAHLPDDIGADAGTLPIIGRWWCKDIVRASIVADAVSKALSREPARYRTEPASALRIILDQAVSRCSEAVHVVTKSDDSIRAEAAAKVELARRQFEELQRGGEMKSFNRSYREYRLAQTAAGLRFVGYKRWCDDYLGRIVADLAQHSKASFWKAKSDTPPGHVTF